MKHFGFTTTPRRLFLNALTFLSYLILAFDIVINFQPLPSSKPSDDTGENQSLPLWLETLWFDPYATKAVAEGDQFSNNRKFKMWCPVIGTELGVRKKPNIYLCMLNTQWKWWKNNRLFMLLIASGMQVKKQWSYNSVSANIRNEGKTTACDWVSHDMFHKRMWSHEFHTWSHFTILLHSCGISIRVTACSSFHS